MVAKKKGFLEVVRERTADRDSKELKATVENYKRQQREREQKEKSEQGSEQPIEQSVEQSSKVVSKVLSNQPIEQGIEQGIKQGSEQSTEQPIEQGIEQSIEKIGAQNSLNKRHVKILLWLIKNNPCTLSAKNISKLLCIPYSTFNRCLSKLEDRGYVNTKTIWDGPFTRKRISANPSQCSFLIEQSIEQPIASDYPLKSEQSIEQGSEQSSEKPIEQSSEQSSNRVSNRATGSIDRKKEEYSIYLNNTFLREYFPCLSEMGWTAAQSKQIVDFWEFHERDKNDLKRLFKMAEELAGDPDFFKNIKQAPLNFLFGSIKNATLHFPAGYKTVYERNMKRIKQQEAELEKQRTQLEARKFDAWKDSLEPDEKAEWLKGSFGPEEKYLKTQWIKYGKPEPGTGTKPLEQNQTRGTNDF